MSESISKARKQRERYKDIDITDIKAFYAVKAELDMLQAELKDVEAEYRLAKRRMWKHCINRDETLFYLGAQMRMIELQEEKECLEPEIKTLGDILIGLENMIGLEMLGGS